MSIVNGMLASAICALVGVSGCSVESVQRAPAQNVDECRAFWKVERGAGQLPVTAGTNDADAFILRLFSGLARQTTATDTADARYDACLRRFGVKDTDAFEASSRRGDPTAPYFPPLAPLRPSYCPPGASVLYGGSGYCVGRER